MGGPGSSDRASAVPDLPEPPDDGEVSAAHVVGSEFRGKVMLVVVALVVGIVASLVLRRLGVLQGVPALALAALALPFALPTPTRLADRMLVVWMIWLGWVPVLGWLPGVLTTIDLGGALLGAGFGLAVGLRLVRRRQTRERLADPSDERRWMQRTADAAFDLVPLLAGAAALRTWMPSVTDGGAVNRLAVLLGLGWDHAAHASMAWQIFELGSYPALDRISPAGTEWYFWRYPQGLHYASDVLVQLSFGRTPDSADELLTSYVWVLAASMFVTVALVGLAVVRVLDGRLRSVLVAVPGLTLVTVLLTFGFGSLTIAAGWSNFMVSAAAMAVVGSVALRSTGSVTADVVIVLGALLVMAYNWYPLAALSVLLTLPVIHRLVVKTGVLRTAAIALAAAGLALPMPILGLGINASVINNPGGIPPTPRPWFLLSVVALFVAGFVVRGSTSRLGAFSLSGTAALAGTSVVALAAYQISELGRIEYYGEKMALAVVLLCTTVAVVAAAAHARSVVERDRTPLWILVPLAAALSVGATQVSGYLGPRWSAVAPTASAAGLLTRSEINRLEPHELDNADQILDAVADVDRSASDQDPTAVSPGFTTVFVAAWTSPSAPMIRDRWFAALNQSWDTRRMLMDFSLSPLNGEATPEQQADLLREGLEPLRAGPITLLATPEVADAIDSLPSGAQLDGEPVLSDPTD